MYAGTPCPIIIILNYESCMNNFFFSLSIFETRVDSVSWASLELIIYVSQAGLKKSYRYFWVRLWSGRITLLWTTILSIWTWNPQTISILIIWRCELQVHSEKKPKTKDQQQSSNKTPQIKTSKYLEEQELNYQRRNNCLISKAPNPNLLLIYTYF